MYRYCPGTCGCAFQSPTMLLVGNCRASTTEKVPSGRYHPSQRSHNDPHNQPLTSELHRFRVMTQLVQKVHVCHKWHGNVHTRIFLCSAKLVDDSHVRVPIMGGGLVLDVLHMCVDAKASLAVVKDNFSFRNSEPRPMQEMIFIQWQCSFCISCSFSRSTYSSDTGAEHPIVVGREIIRKAAFGNQLYHLSPCAWSAT